MTNFARVLHQNVNFFFILNGPEQKMAREEEIFIFCVLLQYSTYFHSFIFISFLIFIYALHYMLLQLLFCFIWLRTFRVFRKLKRLSIFSFFSCILNSFLYFFLYLFWMQTHAKVTEYRMKIFFVLSKEFNVLSKWRKLYKNRKKWQKGKKNNFLCRFATDITKFYPCHMYSI